LETKVRVLFSFIFAISLGACSTMPENGTALPGLVSVAAPQPPGATSYCSAQPAASAQAFWNAFCEADSRPVIVALTPERWHDLQVIQYKVDASLTYASAVSWDPLAPIGDCKTFAARTALTLLDHGWPAGALRIATAFVNDGSRQQGEYHAVLLVDTDRGTIVLDNLHHAPTPWQDLRYIWMTAEVPAGHGTWSLLPNGTAAMQIALTTNLPAQQGREQVASTLTQ
jgi:predicted transglutaminase-like cysteine proteinase